jgi:hypothetical protein
MNRCGLDSFMLRHFERVGGEAAGRWVRKAMGCSLLTHTSCVLAGHYMRRAMDEVTDRYIEHIRAGRWNPEEHGQGHSLAVSFYNQVLNALSMQCGDDLWRRCAERPRAIVSHQTINRAKRRWEDRQVPYRTRKARERHGAMLRAIGAGARGDHHRAAQAGLIYDDQVDAAGSREQERDHGRGYL